MLSARTGAGAPTSLMPEHHDQAPPRGPKHANIFLDSPYAPWHCGTSHPQDKWAQESTKTDGIKRECLQIIIKCEQRVQVGRLACCLAV